MRVEGELYTPFVVPQERMAGVSDGTLDSYYSPVNPTHLPAPNLNRKLELLEFIDNFKRAAEQSGRPIRTMNQLLSHAEKVYGRNGKNAAYGIAAEVKKVVLEDDSIRH